MICLDIKKWSIRVRIVTLWILFVVHSSLVASNMAVRDIDYIHPRPGTDFHNPQTTIILKAKESVLNKLTITATGRNGNIYSGSKSIQNRTLIFRTHKSFVGGDTVDVSVGGLAESYTFYFIVREPIDTERFDASDHIAESENHDHSHKVKVNGVRTINGVAVPDDFPDIRTSIHGETAPGRIFFASTFFDSNSRSNYIVICENDGTPYFYRKYDRANLGSGEFKVQPNDMLSFYRYLNSDDGFYVLLDHNFVEVDTFRAGHGYRTDSHEMLLLDNGHALLVCEQDVRMDMSTIVSGGQKNALVIGNHIQEVDSEGNVYWEWRCWDYLDVADAIEVNLKGGSIDYAQTHKAPCRRVNIASKSSPVKAPIAILIFSSSRKVFPL